jgi:ankyrin repeat protein
MNGMMLLHKGLEQHRVDLDLVRVLVQSNPKALTHQDDKGFLPIHHALFSVPTLSPPIKLELIKYLIEQAPATLLETTSDGALPVHLACCNFGNDFENQLAVVRYLVQLFPESLKHRDNRWLFPLHYALMSDHSNIPVIRFITERYPLALEFATFGAGVLPIQTIIQEQTSRNDAIVSLFVQTCPGTVRFQDSKGYTPLAYACEYDVPLSQIYSLLRAWPEQVSRGTSTFTTDEFNGELLPTTLIGDNVSTSFVRQWIQQSPSVIATPDSQGRIPLHYAALSSSRHALEIVECMVHADTSTLHVVDHHGRLPLHYAAAAGNTPVVQFLVEADPSLLTHEDHEERLAWHYAECARMDEQGELYEQTLDEFDKTNSDHSVDTDLIPEEIRWDVLQARHEWQFCP